MLSEVLKGESRVAQVRAALILRRCVALDGAIDSDLIEKCCSSFPSIETLRKEGAEFNTDHEKNKFSFSDPARFPADFKVLKSALQSAEFIEFLERATRVEGLMADDQLYGCGIEAFDEGGFLLPHLNFNGIPSRQLYRRVSVRVYFDDVAPEDGGQVQMAGLVFQPLKGRIAILWEDGGTSICADQATGNVKRQFTAAYYTKEQPPGFRGWHTSQFIQPQGT